MRLPRGLSKLRTTSSLAPGGIAGKPQTGILLSVGAQNSGLWGSRAGVSGAWDPLKADGGEGAKIVAMCPLPALEPRA